jgi:type II secretory pathway pseudopilin PulG
MVVPSRANIAQRRRSSFAKRLRPSVAFGRGTEAGTLLVELLVAMGLILIVTVSFTHAMLTSNRLAATNRAMTAARSIVQRNIDDALSVTFDSSNPATTTNPNPAILCYTSTTGSVFDDDGTTGLSNMVNILAYSSNGAVIPILQGTLTRIVSAAPNTTGSDIRRVTFRLDYTFQKRNFSTQMVTLRAIDD